MSFKPFRYRVKEKGYPKFEITAETPHKFRVRFPDYDYIKTACGVAVAYNREQLLLFLLAYDEKQCLDFMETLHTNMGSDKEYIEKLRQNPAFRRVQKST